MMDVDILTCSTLRHPRINLSPHVTDNCLLLQNWLCSAFAFEEAVEVQRAQQLLLA